MNISQKLFTVQFSFLLLDRLPANLLAAALASECLFDALLLARFQVEGMLLHFLDNIFLLNLSFEAPQRIFNGLAVLNSNLCQSDTPIRLQ